MAAELDAVVSEVVSLLEAARKASPRSVNAILTETYWEIGRRIVDEDSESDIENALVRELETFLLELGGNFAFIGRQRRLRVGDQWHRIDRAARGVPAGAGWRLRAARAPGG